LRFYAATGSGEAGDQPIKGRVAQWNEGHPVMAAKRLDSGRDHRGVEQVLTEAFG
jgi:hypothetical protein